MISLSVISVTFLGFKSPVRFVAFLTILDFDLFAVSLVTNEHNRKFSGVDNITMLALGVDYTMIHLSSSNFTNAAHIVFFDFPQICP